MGHGGSSIQSASKKDSVARYERVAERKKRRITYDAANALLDLGKHLGTEEEEPPATQTQETQTDLQWDRELAQLTQDNANLRKALGDMQQLTLTEETLKDDEERLTFYTGLPSWITFMAVFNLISPYLPTSGKCKLSVFQQLLLFLVKIRLNLANRDIGYRFMIHHSTVSKIYNRVLDVMSERLGHLIH